MKDKIFLDTNIIIYTFDHKNEDKKEIALKILSGALENESGCISFQVVQEFLNVALRKFKHPLTFDQAHQYLLSVLNPLWEVYPNDLLYHNALEIMERWQYSFYDSVIISSALNCGCKILYSEDLHHGQKIHDLQILNPFISG